MEIDAFMLVGIFTVLFAMLRRLEKLEAFKKQTESHYGATPYRSAGWRWNEEEYGDGGQTQKGNGGIGETVIHYTDGAVRIDRNEALHATAAWRRTKHQN